MNHSTAFPLRNAAWLALAAIAWMTPLALDWIGRSLGIALFDWPWIAVYTNQTVAVVGLVAAIIFAVAARHTGIERCQTLSSIGLAIVAFALGLVPVLKMATGYSSDILMAGLIPVSDAQGYLAGAVNFLWSGQLNEWVTRRPLVVAHLAGVLALDDQSLRISLFILAAGCSAGALLVLALLRQTLGLAAAAIAVVALFPFISPTLGSTMSENLGFTAGCAAFALLWEGACRSRRDLVLWGIGLLSFALAARAGALFVLPALVIWTGWFFSGHRRFHWPLAAGALMAALSGFAATQILVVTIGAPGQIAYSNFAPVIYGLVSRGADWAQAYRDHPELRSLLHEGEQAEMIYRFAWAHVLQAPFDPVIGILRRYNEFLFFKAGWHQYVPSRYLRWGLMLLVVAGTIHCLRHRTKPIPSLLLTGLAGILLSVPFIGEGGTRIFAATHPFTVGLLAVGVMELQRRWLRYETPLFAAQPFAEVGGLLAIAALAPLLLGSVVGKSYPEPLKDAEQLACAADQTAIYGIMPHDSAVLICPVGSPNCTDGVRAESLAATNTAKAPDVENLAGRATPQRIWNAVLAKGSSTVRIIAPAEEPLPEGSFARCAFSRDGYVELAPPSSLP